MQVRVNENCIGCGLCTAMCPAVFVMTGTGFASAQDEIPPEQYDQVWETADSCPGNAIEIDACS